MDLLKSYRIHRKAPVSVNIRDDLCKVIPTPALVVMMLNYCQKGFFFKSSVSFKFTEKKAVNTVLSFYYIQLSCAFREAV